MHATWPVWRLVVEQGYSLSEIDEKWSVRDVLLANEALDAWHEAGARAEKKAAEKARREAKR